MSPTQITQVRAFPLPLSHDLHTPDCKVRPQTGHSDPTNPSSPLTLRESNANSSMGQRFVHPSVVAPITRSRDWAIERHVLQQDRIGPEDLDDLAVVGTPRSEGARPTWSAPLVL